MRADIFFAGLSGEDVIRAAAACAEGGAVVHAGVTGEGFGFIKS